jgi:hypothetical protein
MSNNNPDTNGIHNEVVSQITTLMISAFGLVAALAWNGAIQAMFKQVFGTADGLTAQLSYAIIVTVIVVIVTKWVSKAESHLNGAK